MSRSPDILSQIESAMAALYALMNPHQKLHRPSPQDQTLTTYLQNGIDKEKSDCLVRFDFPGICALSYFFQEGNFHKDTVVVCEKGGYVIRQDFKWSAYDIVSQAQFRGPRPTIGCANNTFPITIRDLNIFPQFTPDGADPCFWPTRFHTIRDSHSDYAHAYTADETMQFCALANNDDHKKSPDDEFRNKSYRAFLRIIVTPQESITRVLKEKITDQETAVSMCSLFVTRKNALQDKLIRSSEFKRWWEKITAQDIQLIFNEFSVHYSNKNNMDYVNIDQAKDCYRDFCCEFARVEMESNHLAVMSLVRSLKSEAGECTLLSLSMYEPLLAFRDVFMKMGAAFFQKPRIVDKDLFHFVAALSNILKGIQTWPFVLTQDNAQAFNHVVSDFEKSIHLLKKYSYATADDFVSIDTVSAHEVMSDDFVLVADKFDLFCFHSPKIDPEHLVRDALLWVQKLQMGGEEDDAALPENKFIVIKMYERVCKSEMTVTHVATQVAAQAVSAVFSAEFAKQTTQSVSGFFGAMSSTFFSRRQSTPTLVTASKSACDTPNSLRNFLRLQLRDDLVAISSQLKQSETAAQLFAVVSNFLSLKCEGARFVKEQFVRELIQQVSREAYAKYVMCQFEDTPHFLSESKESLVNPVPDSVMRDAITLFLDGEDLSQKVTRLDNILTRKEHDIAREKELRRQGIATPDGCDDLLFRPEDFEGMRPLKDEELDEEPSKDPTKHSKSPQHTL